MQIVVVNKVQKDIKYDAKGKGIKEVEVEGHCMVQMYICVIVQKKEGGGGGGDG